MSTTLFYCLSHLFWYAFWYGFATRGPKESLRGFAECTAELFPQIINDLLNMSGLSIGQPSSV